jgi:hypothetical protein
MKSSINAQPGMQFTMIEWLDVMSDCNDLCEDRCLLAGRACEYAKCPGNNVDLGGE